MEPVIDLKSTLSSAEDTCKYYMNSGLLYNTGSVSYHSIPWGITVTNDIIEEMFLPVTQTIFPYKEQTVFVHKNIPGKYYFKKNRGYSKVLKDTQIESNYDKLDIVDSLIEENNQSGVQCPQLIIALIDNLTKKENKTQEELEAIKHLKYSLAYLEKDMINKVKEATALETT